MDVSPEVRSEISAIDPNWRYNEQVDKGMFGKPIHTVQSINATIDSRRFQLAAVISRAKANYVDREVRRDLTAQVRGFFNTDFQPSRVVIIRPRQLGADHTYVISRPETKR